MKTNRSPQLSIITTLYNSAPHLEEFYTRLVQSVESCYSSYELILVNDGSNDNSLAIAKRLIEKDCNVHVIDLTRNFGQHQAIMAGLKHVKGENILLIDCDLEEKPEWLFEFKNKLALDKADVVYGVHSKKGGGFLKKLSSDLFYKIFNHYSSVRLTPNIILFRLMKKAYVSSLLAYNETVLFLPGVMALAGHNQVSLKVEKSYKGATSYNPGRLIHMAIDGITSFSTKPLTSLMIKGLVIFSTSILACIVLLISYLLGTKLPYQFALVLASIWGVCGILLIGLSLVGLYASRALIEAKKRPQVIIKEIFSSEK